MNKKILLFGGGGHCKSVLDSLLELNEYEEIGIVDVRENIGKSVMGIPVIGCEYDLLDLFRRDYKYAFVTVGSVGNPSIRIKFYNLLNEIGYENPSIIDNSAKVSKYAIIDPGVFIGKQSIVNAGSYIYKGAIINSGSIIEHDCQIGAFVHISSGAVMGGGVIIGANSHIGINTAIKQQIHIGSNSIIGMSSVVLHNISDNIIAYGNPCREVRKI